MRSIGLDVHKRFAEVAIITSAAAAPARRRIATTPAALRAFASELGPDDQVVLEATMNTWAPATRLRTKWRRLERIAGIPAARTRLRAALSLRERQAQERAVQDEAEATYRELGRSRQQRADAAAAMGRDSTGPRTQMRGGATRPGLRSSLRGQAASGSAEDTR